MSARVSRYSNHPSALRRPPPIADGFALRRNNIVSCLMRYPEILRSSTGVRHLCDVAVRLIGCITTFSPTANSQISIAV